MKLVLSLSLCACVIQTSGQRFSDVYKPGDKLYVCSAEGISLRPTPDAKSIKIMVVPYATALTVKADANARVSFVSTGVPGNWVKVTTGGKEGYVFDGFVSRFKPMALAKDPSGRELEEIVEYFSTLSKVESKMTWSDNGGTAAPQECDYCFLYDKIVLVNGGEYERKAYEGGSMITTSFPSSTITFQETYLMARMTYNEFFTKDPCPYNEGDMRCPFEGDENLVLRIWTEGGLNMIQWGHAD